MTARSPQPKKSMRTFVQMAIASLDCHPGPNPLDEDMRGVDPSPISLDLPQPVKPDNRHAAEAGAARGSTTGRP